LHDIHRYNKGGKPTHAKVMQAAALLRQYQIPFNALCVVNRDNAKRPLEVYRFIRDQVQPRMIQLIPGMESAQFQRQHQAIGILKIYLNWAVQQRSRAAQTLW
jgi:uncharacterized protein